jgi:hypothetical protein
MGEMRGEREERGWKEGLKGERGEDKGKEKRREDWRK